MKYLKKYISVILIGVMFFSSITSVQASILTIDNVSKEFDESQLITEINKLGLNFSSKINTIDKTLDVYSGDEKIISFAYGDDYIEYDNRSSSLSKEDKERFLKSITLENIMYSVFSLSGYDGKTILFTEIPTDTYDTYGIQLETEKYSLSGEDEDGAWSENGYFIKYLKLSLDTDKIDALMAKYGVSIETQDPSKKIIASIEPSLKADNITENSITLYPSISYFNTDPDYEVNCNIYRSNSEDGTYEKINDKAISCLNSTSYVDKGLKSNTTYFYKVLVEGGTIYSLPLEVTTKASKTVVSENIKEEKKEQTSDVKNPKTGVSYPVITLILLLIGCIIILYIIKKKRKFRNE